MCNILNFSNNRNYPYFKIKIKYLYLNFIDKKNGRNVYKIG